MYKNPLFLQTPSLAEQSFLGTDLSNLHRSIPLSTLASKIPAPDFERSSRGSKPF
jgi:hypothetical protein